MKVQSVQPPPNPHAFKFLLDEKVVPSGVLNYTQASEASGDPLGEALFAVNGVSTLFFCDNFITVSMVETADWREVHDAVVQVLEAAEAPKAAPAAGATTTQAGGPPAGADGDPELLNKINERSPDFLVAEAGASPLEPYNSDAVIDELGENIVCSILCPSGSSYLISNCPRSLSGKKVKPTWCSITPAQAMARMADVMIAHR